MNIFVLDQNPILAAQLQCDKHVVKMIVETAQMLSTAHRILDGEQYIDNSSGRRIKRWRHDSLDDSLYKASHVNHPCNVWLRESSLNYEWLYNHFVALCSEYNLRYNKMHETSRKLRNILGTHPKNLRQGSLTPFALAMPDEYRSDDVVQSYRRYYNSKQSAFKMKWTVRKPPDWVNIE